MQRGKGEKYFAEEKKRGEGKGGKYLERSNTFFVEEKKNEVNIWRRKILVYRG